MHFIKWQCYYLISLFLGEVYNSIAMNWYVAYVAIGIFVVDCAEVCEQKFARLPLAGYRCITNTENDTVINNIPSHICTHQCMSRSSCSLVNYNLIQSTCFLSEELCIILTRDEAFATRHLYKIKPPSECLRWTPPGDVDNAKSVSSTVCGNSPNECQVGRLIIGSDVTPGEYHPHSQEVWASYDATTTNNGIYEVLQVHPDCYVTWLTFDTRTDPTPPVAVEGGYLASRGSKMYVTRNFGNGGFIFGSYLDGIIGFVPDGGFRMVFEMHLLVLF